MMKIRKMKSVSFDGFRANDMSGIVHPDNTPQFQEFARPSSAVVVRGAFKNYGTSYILKDLNMTVPDGKIYGLLGPSGCGKTTLLSCIVGRIALDQGQIKLKTQTISDIGYMPQELALHSELSIRETFTYYGYIFSMSDAQINERAEEMEILFKLPSNKLILRDLSGGQQRRISLAVTLLHDPKLLILDEPTVGLDPLISQSIWDLLLHVTKVEQKTIIITTHYIEEARQADMIGLMRKGTLLTESSPSDLLTTCNCSYLEDAFLKVCQNQITTSECEKVPVKQPARRFSYARDFPAPPLLNNDFFTPGHFRAQFWKNVYLLRRNMLFTLFVVFLPIIQTVIFNLACGHDPKHLGLGVVNQELHNSLSNCDTVPNGLCFLYDNATVSCRLLQKLKERTFKLVEYNDVEGGKYAVSENKVWGLIHFAENYTQNLAVRVNESSATQDDVLQMSTLNTWIDHSNKYIGDLVKREILYSFRDVLHEILSDCSLSPRLGDNPLQINEPVYGNSDPSFIHYASPALMALCAFYLPAIYTGAVILSEKEGGVMERIVLAGMNFLEISIAHIVVQLVFVILQTVLMMIVMFRLFDNPYVGSTFWTFLLLLLIGEGGMCFGFCVAILCKTMTAAAFLGIGTNFLLKFLCGLIWPTEGIHHLLRTVSLYLPLTLSTESLRSLTAKGHTVTHPSVYMGFASTIAWILAFSLFSYCLLKIKRDVWTKT